MYKRPTTYCSLIQFESLEPRQMLTQALPDFGLVDNNSTSATYGQTVSPRDYTGEVSAWYFGHAG